MDDRRAGPPHVWGRTRPLSANHLTTRCQAWHRRVGGRLAAVTIIATSDVMDCADRLPLRLVMAWTETARRRLVTSVMVMLVIKHWVLWPIMMMVMRQYTITARVPWSILRSALTHG